VQSASGSDVPVDALIIDIGAHRGEDSDFYLKLGYRVVAIEANPALAGILRQRFRAAIRAGRLTLIDKAVAESAGPVTFHANRQLSAWGTTDAQRAAWQRSLGTGHDQFQVDAVPLADVITEHGCPHYLKIDTQGSDLRCLASLQGCSCRPKFLSLESSMTSWADLLQEFAVLERLGYSRFAVIDQRRHRSGSFRTLAGATVEHHFEAGASGRFGTQLESLWVSKQAAIRRYRWIFLLYRLIGDHSPVQKLLDRKPLNGWPVIRSLLRLASWHDTHAMRE
jgi:FkbM family methyltransferase